MLGQTDRPRLAERLLGPIVSAPVAKAAAAKLTGDSLQIDEQRASRQSAAQLLVQPSDQSQIALAFGVEQITPHARRHHVVADLNDARPHLSFNEAPRALPECELVCNALLRRSLRAVG